MMTRPRLTAVSTAGALCLAALAATSGCSQATVGNSSGPTSVPAPASTGTDTPPAAAAQAPGSSTADAPTSHGVTCFGDLSGGLGAGQAPSVPGFPGMSVIGFGAQASSFIAPTTVLSKAPPAISGGTLMVLPGDLVAVAADPDRDQVYVVDLYDLQVTATIALLPGDEPGRVIADAAGRVEVALRGGGAIVTIDPVAGTILQRREVCAAPRGLAYDAKSDLIHVACAGGELVSLPAVGGNAVRRLQLDPDLRDVVVEGDHLRVSRFRSAEILTVDANGAVSARTRLGAFRSANARGGQSFTPAVAWRMVGVPGGGLAMVHQRGVDDEIQRGQPGHVVVGSYGGGAMPFPGKSRGCDGVVHSAISRVKLDGSISNGPALPDVPLPVDLAVSADGQHVAIVSAGNDGTQFPSITTGPVMGVHVSDIDMATGGTSTSCIPDAGPMDCWGTTSMEYCGTAQSMRGQGIAVAFTKSGTLLVQSREPALLKVGGQRVTLSDDSRRDTGHSLFHVNAGAGLACASCHPEGSDDGRAWNFTCTGLRRTQSLQTGIRGTEPFHWDGDERDFSQLARDVFTGRMSGPELMADQTDAVLTWLDGQPRVKRTAPADPAAVGRGQAIFNRPTDGTSCATCHAGPGMTNSKTVDVGTGGALQVPSLVGLANHPPYMHNGCAATLLDRFNPACGGGDKHGVTSPLAASELADLVSYLQTL